MAWKAKTELNPADAKKIESSILQVEEQKKNTIFQLGEAFYSANRENSKLEGIYRQKVDTVNKLDFNRKVWINRKMKLQGMRICEGCGNVLPYESNFCNRCGVKLEAVAEELVLISEFAPVNEQQPE